MATFRPVRGVVQSAQGSPCSESWAPSSCRAPCPGLGRAGNIEPQAMPIPWYYGKDIQNDTEYASTTTSSAETTEAQTFEEEIVGIPNRGY